MQKFGHGNSVSEPAPASADAATEGSANKDFLSTWTIDASQDRYYYWTVVVRLFIP
ncbi:unnamed protein product [Cylicostephanus goldi]|uniref:Uncharacterized protein n=1 Tax=Cylicostephanus goldi TaxID=71465 RepID=A0A3P6UXL3_CYLGO|nr:unnamed protein product [Cylicostephanus goldi]